MKSKFLLVGIIVVFFFGLAFTAKDTIGTQSALALVKVDGMNLDQRTYPNPARPDLCAAVYPNPFLVNYSAYNNFGLTSPTLLYAEESGFSPERILNNCSNSGQYSCFQPSQAINDDLSLIGAANTPSYCGIVTRSRPGQIAVVSDGSQEGDANMVASRWSKISSSHQSDYQQNQENYFWTMVISVNHLARPPNSYPNPMYEIDGMVCYVVSREDDHATVTKAQAQKIPNLVSVVNYSYCLVSYPAPTWKKELVEPKMPITGSDSYSLISDHGKPIPMASEFFSMANTREFDQQKEIFAKLIIGALSSAPDL